MSATRMEGNVFETALGLFALCWTAKGIARTYLPGLSEADLRTRLAERSVTLAPPSEAIGELVSRITAYASGERSDFSDVPLDLDGVPDFHRRAYAALLRIGWGETITYGALARQLGDVTLSRAVGQAMGANPVPLIVPCHRVLASDGKPGGFSAPGGAESKIRMLLLEGVTVGTPPGQYVFAF